MITDVISYVCFGLLVALIVYLFLCNHFKMLRRIQYLEMRLEGMEHSLGVETEIKDET